MSIISAHIFSSPGPRRVKFNCILFVNPSREKSLLLKGITVNEKLQNTGNFSLHPFVIKMVFSEGSIALIMRPKIPKKDQVCLEVA